MFDLNIPQLNEDELLIDSGNKSGHINQNDSLSILESDLIEEIKKEIVVLPEESKLLGLC